MGDPVIAAAYTNIPALSTGKRMENRNEQTPKESKEQPVKSPSTETSKGPADEDQADNASANEESSESKEVDAGQ